MPIESCEPILNKASVATGTATRNNYFSGKEMNAKDLILEQSYFIEKIRRINRELSGYGIVNGLTIAELNSSKKEIEINPGIGIDSHGNFLALYQTRVFTLDRKLEDGDYIYLKFLEKGQQRVPREDDEECGSECCFNHIAEDMEMVLDKNLLILEANDICHGSKEIKVQHKLAYLKDKVPFLLLGQYHKKGDKKGVIDNSKRIELHTNAELSKLLCDIEHHHVRSLNGKTGNLFALSSINGEEPTATGAFEIIAGNNISITNENSQIKIATTNGFYKKYEFSLKKNSKYIIVHNRNTFPSVDIYKGVEDKPYNVVYEYKELIEKARDMELQPMEYFEMIGAITLKDMIDKKNVTRDVSKKKTSDLYKNSKMRTKNLLDQYAVTEYSDKVIKFLDKEIRYNFENMIIVKHYHYEKIIGGSSDIHIKVTHLDNKRMEIKNLGATIQLLVILNT